MGKTQQKPPAAELVEDGFCSIPEVARFLHLSRAKVYQLMDAGELKYAKFGRSREFPRRAMMEFARNSLAK